MSDYQTPHKDGEVEKSLDEEDDLNDRENAEEFYTLMKEKGHCFGTCKGKLLWYDPANGVYDEESDELKLKLLNLFATSPVIARKYRGSNSKKSALYKEFKSLLPQENSFYEKSRENTKGLFAFNNCIWDFGKQKSRDFSPDYCFTFKAPVDYKQHGILLETEVRQTVFQSIFGEGEKGEFVAKLLARALAGDVEDKRFVVLIGETNSGKGCLTQLLGDCFGLGTFVGNYQSKNLQSESPTLSWLLQNKNCRIILANEINTERPILANNIRMCASGGEPITALAKYKNEENFISQATMFLFCNEMPEIKGNDDGDAVKNRMVYVETEYSYLEKQKYEEMKNTNSTVRLADPTLKSEYLKRKDIQEAFVSLVCGAYVSTAPPLPECCIKKSLEYKPKKSLKKRLENIIDFTGDENDYVVFSDLYEHFSGVETVKQVGDALTKMGFKVKNKKIDGVSKNCRLGIKLKDFENITEEYGDDTSAELSFASTDVEMLSPMRNKSDVIEIEKLKAKNERLEQELVNMKEFYYCSNKVEKADTPGPLTPNKMMLALDASVAIEENRKLIAEITALKEASISPLGLDFELQMLRDENTELKQTLERQNLSSREEEEEVAEEEEEDLLLVPEVSKKKIDQLLSTTAKTMRSSTVQNVLKGLWAKNQQMETEQLDQLQRETELTEELNDLLVKEEEKNKDLTTIIKQVERQTRTKVLDDNGGVLPDVLRRARDVALVDTFDTE
ncbi:unnamed protein product [Bathycoccus prasinos]